MGGAGAGGAVLRGAMAGGAALAGAAVPGDAVVAGSLVGTAPSGTAVPGATLAGTAVPGAAMGLAVAEGGAGEVAGDAADNARGVIAAEAAGLLEALLPCGAQAVTTRGSPSTAPAANFPKK